MTSPLGAQCLTHTWLERRTCNERDQLPELTWSSLPVCAAGAPKTQSQRTRHLHPSPVHALIQQLAGIFHFLLPYSCFIYQTSFLLLLSLIELLSGVTGLPRWLRSKKSTWKCRRRRFNPWVRKIPWRRKWQPTPVFLPRRSHWQRSLAGYSPWGRPAKSWTWLSH